MPNVRDHDASVYLKLQGDALQVGGYEVDPIFIEKVCNCDSGQDTKLIQNHFSLIKTLLLDCMSSTMTCLEFILKELSTEFLVLRM